MYSVKNLSKKTGKSAGYLYKVIKNKFPEIKDVSKMSKEDFENILKYFEGKKNYKKDNKCSCKEEKENCSCEEEETSDDGHCKIIIKVEKVPVIDRTPIIKVVRSFPIIEEEEEEEEEEDDVIDKILSILGF